MRILVVDDVQMSLYQVEKAVRPFGEVTARNNPLQALKEFTFTLTPKLQPKKLVALKGGIDVHETSR